MRRRRETPVLGTKNKEGELIGEWKYHREAAMVSSGLLEMEMMIRH